MEDFAGGNRTVFHRKTERIDWRKLSAVDIDRVIQQNDVIALRDNIKHVAFCDVDAEMELRSGDRTLVKMFKLSQLMIDYLLSSQEHLAGMAAEAEERCLALGEETENAKRKVQENEGYINELKRECHRRKKLILAQQQIMDSGPETYHRCPYCVKAFLNGSFLQAHLEKRHGERYIRSMYLIESQRERSPRREHKQDFHSSSEKRIEELVKQFQVQQRISGDKSDEMEKMRKMMEDMMREQRDQMEGVIEDLERRLADANRRQDKTRSHLGDLVDDRDDSSSQKARQLAVEKAINEKRKKKKAQKPSEIEERSPVALKRREKHDTMQPQRNTSPIRTKSPPRHKSPPRQKSPVHHETFVQTLSPDRHKTPEIIRPSVLSQNSGQSPSNVSDLSNFDAMWEGNDQYRIEAREEVINMLADHLEHHGINRNVPGITDSVLNDKLNVTDMEQRQLCIKYTDFADIRKRLVEEVEQEAYNKLRNIESPKKQPVRLPQPKESQKPVIPEVRAPSPQPRRNIQEKQKDVVISSESDWDENSVMNNKEKRKDNIKQEKEALRRNKQEYEEGLEDILRSPRRHTGQTNNARASSELSNTMGSSMWDHSESKAVTSVAAPGLRKSGPTNKSSDLGNQTDSFDET